MGYLVNAMSQMAKINLTFEQIGLNRKEEKKVLLDYLQNEFAILNQTRGLLAKKKDNVFA